MDKVQRVQIASQVDPWWERETMLTIAEAAQILGVSYATALWLTQKGRLREGPAGSHFVSRASVRGLLKEWRSAQ